MKTFKDGNGNTVIDQDTTTQSSPPVTPVPEGCTVLGAPRIAWNADSILRSPFFWLVVGLAAGFFAAHKLLDKHSR